MTIYLYLLREITRPLAAILGALLALFASYSAASFLADAANGLLPTGVIAELVGLKLIIALEVLIPAALYVSVILAFTRLYGDSEFAALSALRVTPGAVMRSVLTVSLGLAVVAGSLSLTVRPWAYSQLHTLSNQASTLLDVNEMVPGSFYVGQNGTRVISLARRDTRRGPAQDIFVKLRDPDHTEIISAELGYSLPGAARGDGAQVYLHNAHIYDLDHKDGSADGVLHAGGVVVNTNTGHAEPPGYSAVAARTATIARSTSPDDIAEFQWRLSTPLTTLLLGMLAVPLSRAKPREGRYAKLGTAMVIYFGYYLLSTSARTWVQHGAIARFPGIWWVSALLALLVVFTLYPVRLADAFRRADA